MKQGDRVEVIKQGLVSTGKKGVVREVYKKLRIDCGWHDVVSVSLNNGKTLEFAEESLKVIEDKQTQGFGGNDKVAILMQDVEPPIFIIACDDDGEAVENACGYDTQKIYIQGDTSNSEIEEFIEDNQERVLHFFKAVKSGRFEVVEKYVWEDDDLL